uniref:Ankyrin repeat protein n=1 Tax=Panagrolaimus davidi TaxID=227884 RepID=A0A914QPB2_9BILA
MRLAVEHNRLNIVEYLHIRLSLFSDYKREHFILHLAAQKGFLKMVDLLLQYGWNIEELDHTGQTILHVAAENDNVPLIKMLLKKRNNKSFMELKDEDGNTPILDAAWKNNCEAFKVLHSAGASLSACSNFDQTILSAATRSNSVQIVQALIQFYENVNPLNSSNETPLHLAVKFNSIEIVKQILKLSTFSVCLNSSEGTPLMIAVEKGFVTIVEMLIKNNATKKLKIMERKILLQISIYHKRYQVLKLLSKDLSKDLLEQNDIDKILQHSLKLSIIEEFIEGVEYFLNRNDWKNLMRRRPKTELNSILKSPMQLLIENLPQMALIVFDKCFVIAYITVLSKTKEVTFADYEFLDDVYFIQNHPNALKNGNLFLLKF